MRFFDPKGKKLKIWDFKGKFSNAKPKLKIADPTHHYFMLCLTSLYNGLIENCFTEQKSQGVAFTFNGAKKKAGVNNYEIRIEMKKKYFKFEVPLF